MTQQFEREAIALLTALLIFARAIFPKPLMERNNKPYGNQLFARVGLLLFGLFMVCVWYGIHSEGMPRH